MFGSCGCGSEVTVLRLCVGPGQCQLVLMFGQWCTLGDSGVISTPTPPASCNTGGGVTHMLWPGWKGHTGDPHEILTLLTTNQQGQ
mmetsp:Transcript_82163/g.137215  ORF Transcript_82163/g.137215 Transcript_82163/m.137215 type:complete len:86 (-) Transcript_82163:228-485(-)